MVDKESGIITSWWCLKNEWDIEASLLAFAKGDALDLQCCTFAIGHIILALIAPKLTRRIKWEKLMVYVIVRSLCIPSLIYQPLKPMCNWNWTYVESIGWMDL